MMVCDWQIQMFPVNEECVAMPVSKTHALGEALIYCLPGRNRPSLSAVFGAKLGA